MREKMVDTTDNQITTPAGNSGNSLLQQSSTAMSNVLKMASQPSIQRSYQW